MKVLSGLAVVGAWALHAANVSAARYDEDGDAALYAWRTVGHHRFNSSALPSANDTDSTITVHLVPHAHLDVGWLKTVEECWYGANQSIQDAAVSDIIDSVIGSLALDKSRKWTMGEQAFFQRWWHARTSRGDAAANTTAALVRRLVADRQLVFVDGGWSQHDTGCTHYSTMLDQTTFGQAFLTEQFDVVPRVGWHLDPFGHTATQGSLLTAEIGFDAFFFGRMDYQDRDARRARGDMEMIWRPSRSLNTSVLAGALPVGTYCPPPRFNFGGDPATASQPVMDDPLLEEMNVAAYVQAFVEDMTEYASYVRGSHVMILMGCDYSYRDAATWYSNMDRLIRAVNSDGRIRTLYSDPETYIDAKHAEQEAAGSQLSFPVFANDDFIPISQDFPPGPLRGHMYWTGYFTSRPGLKVLVRKASALLRAARMLRSIAGSDSQNSSWSAKSNPRWPQQGGLDELATAVGVGAHHDAITGTERQPVADDYSRRLSAGMAAADALIHDALNRLSVQRLHAADESELDFQSCHLLNESVCAVSTRTLASGGTLRLLAFNPLSHSRQNTLLRLPAGHICNEPEAANFTVVVKDSVSGVVVARSPQALLLPATPFASSSQKAASGAAGSQEGPNAASCVVTFNFSFAALEMKSFEVHVEGATIESQNKKPARRRENVNQRTTTHRHLRPAEGIDGVHRHNLAQMASDNVTLENANFAVVFDGTSGRLSELVDKRSGSRAAVDQGFFFYPATNSGPWMLRPDVPDRTLPPQCASSCNATLSVTRNASSGAIIEVHQRFGSGDEDEAWVAQTARLGDSGFLELEWTVGPIPVDVNSDHSFSDAAGSSKEIFSRFSSDLLGSGTKWHVDSNGYEIMERTRDFRSSYTLNLTEPVAANVVNVNSAIFIRDSDSGISAGADNRALVVLNDRSQGGTSLAPGQLDLFVHRRLLGCDYPGGGGVEPLNETRGFSADPTGGVNPTRWGPGVVVRGKHFVQLTTESAASRFYRQQHEIVLNPMILAMADVSAIETIDATKNEQSNTLSKTATSNAASSSPSPTVVMHDVLPDNILMLSLERFDDGVDAMAPYLLVRLQHRYGVGEDAELAKPVNISLSKLATLIGIEAGLAPDFGSRASEVTLTNNQAVATMRKRLQWRPDDGRNPTEEMLTAQQSDTRELLSDVVSLAPLQIRAFRLPLAKATKVISKAHNQRKVHHDNSQP